MSTRRWRTIAGLAVFAGLLTTGAALAKPGWAGGWQGQETQIGGGDKAYPIRVTLTENGGVTDYPALQCGGVLKRIGAQGAYVFFTETITRGDCVSGIVTLAPAGDKLGWSWFGVIEGEAIYAFATLERRAES